MMNEQAVAEAVAAFAGKRQVERYCSRDWGEVGPRGWTEVPFRTPLAKILRDIAAGTAYRVKPEPPRPVPPKGIPEMLTPFKIADAFSAYANGKPLEALDLGTGEWSTLAARSACDLATAVSRGIYVRAKAEPPADPSPVQASGTDAHGPEPWATFGKQAIDANQRIVAQCSSEKDSERIVACVNFCRGIPATDMTNLGTAGYPAYLWAMELATRTATIAVHGSFPGPKEFFEPGTDL